MPKVCGGTARAPDRVSPQSGDRHNSSIPRRERKAAERRGHVTPVTDDVDEARLGKHARQDVDVGGVHGRLVAVAGLAPRSGVAAVEGAQAGGQVPVLDLGQEAGELFAAHREVCPGRHGGEGVEKLVARDGAPLEAPGDLTEGRLRRQRELGMRVELQPEERRARAGHADDERCRSEVGGWKHALAHVSQTMSRMISAIPSPIPVIESGVRLSAQKPGFACDAE